MKLELIENWHRAWKFASVQVFAVIAVLPDVYNGVAALGWMDELPEGAKWAIRAAGAVGVIARIVRKQQPEPKP